MGCLGWIFEVGGVELESCREDGKCGGKWYFGGSFGTNLGPLLYGPLITGRASKPFT
jgi:hypothetical protein